MDYLHVRHLNSDGITVSQRVRPISLNDDSIFHRKLWSQFEFAPFVTVEIASSSPRKTGSSTIESFLPAERHPRMVSVF
jgi:hypothetical protein